VASQNDIRDRAAEFQALFGDEAAFRTWYDRALPRVYAFVLARCGGGTGEALDLTQETFVDAIRDRRRYDGRADPITWLCAIARHKIADHFRKRMREERRRLALVAAEPAEDAGPAPSNHVDARAAVLEALRGIPATQGVVLALHYLDGHSVREIAELLGRSQSAVESLLTRARDGFKRVYTESPEGEAW
jgi:RNA polymerase sigma-70 factor (ECF subfamily)